MTVSPSSFQDLDFAVARGLIGFAIIDSELIVRERHGGLAQWLPDIGQICTQAPLLFAMAPALRDLQADGAAPLILPSVGLDAAPGVRINISIAWNRATERYLAIVAPDAGTEQLDRLLIHQRREKQLLQQQAAAAADRLQVSATLYRDIVESTEDVVLRLAPDMTLSFVNGPAAALIGVNPEAVIGRPVRAVLPLPAIENPWRADMCANGAASFEQPLRGRDGAVRWLWWRAHWLGDDGGPREFQAVGRDVTDVRRLRAELERANEEARFAALAEERLRIAHDLHDTFVNTLVSTLARLSVLRRAASEGALKADLEQAEQEAREGLSEARRAVGAIRAQIGFAEGPRAALVEAAEALRAKMNVALDLDDDFGPLTPTQTTAIVRVAREALRNVERHSGARNLDVSLRRKGGALVLEILDDGIGFDPARGASGHYGLVGMREQARFAGGELAIAPRKGGGVRLTLTLPANALLSVEEAS
jgi:PAS domain S-box-containing protein